MAQLVSFRQSFSAVDEKMVDELRRQLSHEVKRVCPSCLASHQEDIVQAGLIRVVRLMDRDGGASFSSVYLRKVAVSVTIDELRRQRRRYEDILDSGSVGLIPEPIPGPEERVMGQQVGRAIREGLARLGDDRRVAVVMHLRGHSVPEAAISLGWSRKRVANLTYRGLQDLRRGLVAKGIYAADVRQTAPA